MDGFMTTREVADAIGMSVRWIENRIRDGSLTAYAWDTGSRRVFRIRRADFEQFRATHLRAATDLPPLSERIDEEED